MFEISTCPAASAAVRSLIGVPASAPAERQGEHREQRRSSQHTAEGRNLNRIGHSGILSNFVVRRADPFGPVSWLTLASTASSSW